VHVAIHHLLRVDSSPSQQVTQQFCHLDYATLKRYLQLCGVRQPPAKSAAARLARQHFSATAIVNEEQTIVNNVSAVLLVVIVVVVVVSL